MSSILYDNVMVGMDLTYSDSYLLQYIRRFSFLLKPSKYIFFNLQIPAKLSEEIQNRFPQISDDYNQDKLKEKVEREFDFKPIDSSSFYLFDSKNPFESIVQNYQNGKHHLTLISTSSPNDLQGISHKTLARLAKSDVLIVPSKKFISIKKIYLALDLSVFSKHVLEKACVLAKLNNASIEIEHYYDIPANYQKSGLTYHEAADLIKNIAEKKIQDLISDYKDINIHFQIKISEKNDIPEVLIDSAKSKKADLLIIGAKGTLDQPQMMLGKITEGILYLNTELPLLIIKE